MEKEQIVSTLSNEIGQTSFSQRTIAAYVDAHPIAEGQEPTEDYFKSAAAFFKSLGGQYSADVANQVNTFKATWAKEHPTPKPKEGPAPKTEVQEDDKYAALLKKFESLENAFNGQQARNKEEAVRKELSGKAEGLKVSNTYLWNKVVKSIEITEGMDSTQLLNVVKNTYEEELKNIIGSGATPYGVGGSPKPQETPQAVKDFFAKKKAAKQK